jgi:TolB-like protein
MRFAPARGCATVARLDRRSGRTTHANGTVPRVALWPRAYWSPTFRVLDLPRETRSTTNSPALRAPGGYVILVVTFDEILSTTVTSEPTTRAVFLSYASQDAEPAQRLCAELQASGIQVWFDRSELRGGDLWDRQIAQQIRQCALFIPVISTHTDARAEGYFRREWRMAVDRMRDIADDEAFLVPVILDETPDATARVPDAFRHVQWTRLASAGSSPSFVEHVLHLLSAGGHAGTPATQARSLPVGPLAQIEGRAAEQHAVAPRRSVTWVVVAAILVAASAVFVQQFIARNPASPAGQSATPAGQPASAGTVALDKSIAVLPFMDLSEKADQNYLAAGMASEVIDLLAKVPGLKVIGRSSSFRFSGNSQDLRTIGRTLGVGYIVEGSVTRSGDHVRVSAQLIDARDGSQHWSSAFDRKAADVFELQDAIALSLARALQITVSSDFGSRSAALNAEAYGAYLRGLHAFDQASRTSMDEAAGEFQRALDLDPAFAAAALGLAKVYAFEGEEGWGGTTVAFERARQAATLAAKLDARLGAAHVVLADIHTIYDWDWASAEAEIARAESLGGRVEAIAARARLAAVRGDWDLATQLFQKGLAADPLNAYLHFAMAWGVDLRSGRYEQAEAMFRRTLEISPGFGSGRWFLGLSLLFQNRLEEALELMKQEKSGDGLDEGPAIVYFAMARKTEAAAALKRAIEVDGHAWPSAIARVYAFRGEHERAMRWLEQAYAQKDEDLYFIKSDPLMKNLEGDARYQAFLRKMKL